VGKKEVQMGPQCEDGYTKIANELLEALSRIRIPGESMQIFLIILRKTYGFGKKEDRISLSQFQETGIVKTHIPRAINKLIAMNMITKKGNGNSVTYGINKHYGTWKQLPKKVTVTQKGNESLPKKVISLPKKVHTKETLQKKLSKESMLEICIAWKAFVEMRKTIKKPMTEYAMKLRVKELEKLVLQGEDPIAVLNQSTSSNYQDLYPVKKKAAFGVNKEFEKTPMDEEMRRKISERLSSL
jgi:phage replication O-like protein O